MGSQWDNEDSSRAWFVRGPELTRIANVDQRLPFVNAQDPDFDGCLNRALALRMTSEKDVMAEWQRLMSRWESACASYAAMFESNPEVRGQCDERAVDDAAIEQARRNLIEIKLQIDSLIAARGRVRAASPGPLRFALLEALTNRFVGVKSAQDSTYSDQASPRYNKR